jgi:protein involved in ribonucleotide reduction
MMTTLKFTSRTDNTANFTDTTSVNQDTDLDSTGKTIGYDNTYVTATDANTLSADAALAINGGFLYATFSTKDGGQTWNGEVTGGTGNFKGATGTVTASASSQTELAVTVHYS